MRKPPLGVSVGPADDDSWRGGATHHIRNVVRVHLVQVLVIDVGIGKVEPAERHSVSVTAPPGGKRHHILRPRAHPSTRSPMLSRWPRNVRQWYCWLVSISDVFWTHSSARVCCRPSDETHQERKHVFLIGWAIQMLLWASVRDESFDCSRATISCLAAGEASWHFFKR